MMSASNQITGRLIYSLSLQSPAHEENFRALGRHRHPVILSFRQHCHYGQNHAGNLALL